MPPPRPHCLHSHDRKSLITAAVQESIGRDGNRDKDTFRRTGLEESVWQTCVESKDEEEPQSKAATSFYILCSTPIGSSMCQSQLEYPPASGRCTSG
ncbi:hypothetical protein E2C01_042362 [Portunus trituberculatus]|uniref:Uncharacterized protein n=1 Tax=Portunus trituberculatus TaxID=210409 RepID=A0A5B7FTF2_PORTR|nr:hypothetical protein [Portunus trituberculatus]